MTAPSPTYAYIMRRTRTPEGRKSIALARIGVHYEEVRSYSRCASMDKVELSIRAAELKSHIHSLCARHGISRDELKTYFHRNHYSLSLNF